MNGTSIFKLAAKSASCRQVCVLGVIGVIWGDGVGVLCPGCHAERSEESGVWVGDSSLRSE